MADRDDAALVYRYLRDHGAGSVAQIVDACFPTIQAGDAPPSTVLAIRRRSVSRALSSVQWMRDQGVVIFCEMSTSPGDLSRFSLIASQGGEAPVE
jgi:hypothetical protein